MSAKTNRLKNRLRIQAERHERDRRLAVNGKVVALEVRCQKLQEEIKKIIRSMVRAEVVDDVSYPGFANLRVTADMQDENYKCRSAGYEMVLNKASLRDSVNPGGFIEHIATEIASDIIRFAVKERLVFSGGKR